MRSQCAFRVYPSIPLSRYYHCTHNAFSLCSPRIPSQCTYNPTCMLAAHSSLYHCILHCAIIVLSLIHSILTIRQVRSPPKDLLVAIYCGISVSKPCDTGRLNAVYKIVRSPKSNLTNPRRAQHEMFIWKCDLWAGVLQTYSHGVCDALSL